MRWAIVMGVVGAAGVASADPSAKPATLPHAVLADSDAPRACTEPACDAASEKPGDELVPVDVKIPLGGIAIASMEGLWLRRGPTLRDKPIMISPIVVAGALTLSLGGSF
jgi:hypothetical protein